MKRVFLMLVVMAACVGLAVAAGNQQYFQQAVEITTNPSTDNNVFSRCWQPTFDTINPGGAGSCASSGTQVGFDSATRSCRLKWSSAQARGFKGYTENIFNDPALAGEARHCVLDMETGTAGAGHIGYYQWAWKNINDVAGAWQPLLLACNGTQDQVCLSPGSASTAAGTAIPNTPLGTILPIGGFRPIPVPVVTGANKNTGEMFLSWIGASSLGDAVDAPLYSIVGLAKTSCTPPVASEFNTPGHTYANQAGTTLTANVADFGFGPNDQRCYYFALRLVYPNAGVNPVTSLFVSANSQGVVFGGLATEVYDVAARFFRNGVNVTWKSSLEEGTVKYEIMRGYAQTGPFSKVGEVAANGQPSSYSFLDTTVPPAARKTAWYSINAVDVDNNASKFGPVLASK